MHPHQHLLEEYKISIDRLVPLTPPAVIGEAKQIYETLQKDEAATERQILQALILIGKKEYPYRKAYQAICQSDEEQRLQNAVFERIDPSIKEKMKKVTEHGVHVTDYVDSKLFEKDLLPEERYRVEQAIFEAHDIINKQCDERAHERQQKYEDLVREWTAKEERMQALIDQLRAMAPRDAKWAAEITGKADQFEQGWSIVERDPEETEIQKEIENWVAVFEETPEGESESTEELV